MEGSEAPAVLEALEDFWPSSEEALGSKAPYPANASREGLTAPGSLSLEFRQLGV